MRVKVRCTENDSAKWKAAVLVGDAAKECKVQFVGTDTMEAVSLERLCFLGAAPFRTPTAKEKACAGRSVEVHLGGRAARARVKRVFVSDDEGPAHDETLCGLVDDAEPSRERTVRAAELLRAVRTATHVKWADASVEEAPPPPAKRRRPARAVASAVAAAS